MRTLDQNVEAASCELCQGPVAHLCRLPSKRLDVGRCEDCQLVSVLPRCAPPAGPPEMRPSDGDGMAYERYIASQRTDELREKHIKTLDRLKSFLPSDCANLLYDVGAGAGTFLVEARQAGFDVMGNDISEHAVRLSAERHGIRLSHMDLSEEPGANRMDAVTMWCVLAHVDDPRDMLGEIFRLLQHGGVLYFHTPRWSFIDTLGLVALRVSGGRIDNLIARRVNGTHRRLYSQHNLSQLLTAVGFEIIEVEPQIGYSLRTASYLESMRVPKPLVRPLAAALDWLMSAGAVPKNILDVYARKPLDPHPELANKPRAGG